MPRVCVERQQQGRPALDDPSSGMSVPARIRRTSTSLSARRGVALDSLSGVRRAAPI
jgi:hypothetical protein